MDKQRFVLAIVFSAAILFAWSLLFPVKPPPPQTNNANSNSSVAEQKASPTANSSGISSASQDKQSLPASGMELTPESTAPRTIRVSTPLYDVSLDNRGAVATSWIIKKNKDNKRPLYSVGGSKDQLKPLELISQEGINREPREAPLRIQTVDGAMTSDGKLVDFLLDSRNYSVAEINDKNESAELQSDNFDIQEGKTRSLEFYLKVKYGPAGKESNLEARKIITFYADHYRADIKIYLKQDDQPKPAKLLIGPSIGDQGISEYSFYSVAPEGVATVGEEVGKRHNALAINHKTSDREIVNGAVDWAGVADTYFAMVAVPQQKTEGLEYRTSMAEHSRVINGQPRKEARYLITAYIPVPTDGSPTYLYVGPKDHYILQDASTDIGAQVRRPVDLEGLIDYGFLSWMSRPLAVPILWSIKFLYNVMGSYGIAIILFTIVIYSLFFPLKWRSSKAMKKAQKMAPRMKELQEKMKSMKKTDPRLRELQMEQMRLMKEGNPLGGCLPLLIQMPFLFALYRAITISIDFRQASFLWIPDLSAAEPTYIHILPILMAGSMMVLQLITPAPSADPVQRKMMAIGMPLLMLWMLWSAPAGLLVYWLVGNVVGFGQQFLINHLTKAKDDEPPPGKKADTRSTKKLNARVSQA
jgi:YidC/Oxa1 family membrane protein insertase